jgi:hypothetical protein
LAVFRNDGSLFVLKQNQLRTPDLKVNQIKGVKNEDQRATYEQVKDILLKDENGSLVKGEDEPMAQNFQIGLGRLGLVRDQENFHDDPYFSRNLLE